MEFCYHCGMPLRSTGRCSCSASVLATFELPALKSELSAIEEMVKASRATHLETLPMIDGSIIDAAKNFPNDYVSQLEGAKLAGAIPEPVLLDQATQLREQMAGWDETFGAHARAMGESSATAAGALARMADLGAPLFTALPDLYKPLMESWQEAALISPLAAVQSPFDEIARLVAKESELWGSLRESADLRFSVVALSSLKNAIDLEPFSDSTIAALRDQLGDWSAAPWIDPALDAAARLDRYYELGLEPRLVESPPPVFGKVLRFTGIREEKPRSPSRQYLLVPEAGEEHEPVDDETMVDVYRRLRSVESRLREFIDRIMIAAHGTGWFRSRVPGDVLARSKERRKERLEAGRIPHDSPLLFVDLGDCLKIIQRGDNWPHFAQHFRRKEAVQESFARLTPLRADTAHSRSFSNADLLFFYSEILRIDLAIDRDLEGDDDEGEESR